jgi:hypothetical protein
MNPDRLFNMVIILFLLVVLSITLGSVALSKSLSTTTNLTQKQIITLDNISNNTNFTLAGCFAAKCFTDDFVPLPNNTPHVDPVFFSVSEGIVICQDVNTQTLHIGDTLAVTPLTLTFSDTLVLSKSGIVSSNLFQMETSVTVSETFRVGEFTTTERLALSPDPGTIVYDSTIGVLSIYQSGAWFLVSGASGITSISSTTLAITGTSSDPIINLTPTGISANTYQFATVTFDAFGRATNAVNNTVVLGITSSTLTLTGTATNPIINLTPTAITAGLYQFATVTFDAFGRATNAVNNTVVLGITSSTLTLTGTATNPIINLTPTAITPATYQFATVTFDTYGRATNAVNNTVVLGITSSTLTLTGTATNPIINLTPTAITPATYQFATVTFDTYGRATNAVNNTVVLGITSSTLTLTGTATNPIINLTPTAITPNTYQLPTVTFDTYGRATSAVQNTLTGTTNQIDVTSFPNPVISLNATFLTTVNGKVSKAGDTMTGQLNSTFVGSQSVPNFSINSNSGIFQSATNHLNFATNGVNRLDIDNLGSVTIVTLPTGVVKSASGLLSAGLVQNAEIATQTPSSVINSIVSRDEFKNFAANMISLSGTTTLPHDVATKDYVDTAVSLGLSVKTPVVVVSVTPISSPPTGPQTIDGVILTNGDRVLLVGQSIGEEKYNGAWIANTAPLGVWTRPTDFNTGDQAGAAYFLVQMGTVYTGSSWVCSTPTAMIDSNPLSFSQFSTPQSASGQNDSTINATVYKSASGSTLHFRSLLNDPNNYLTMTEQTDDVKFVVNATPLGNSNTIVARDGSGNFLSNMITLSTGLIVSAGSFASPSIQVGPVSTGLSSASGNLQLSTAFGLGLSISSITGIVTLSALTTIGIVHNDATGLLSTSLIVNADIDAAAAIVDTKLATISTIGKVSNTATTATSALGINTIVLRDASNNFSAGTITANLTGNATSANSFSGSLLGDVTGTQSATVVGFVGGETAANVASGAILANASTSANTFSTIVRRDGSGNFSAGTITVNSIIGGNLVTNTTNLSTPGHLVSYSDSAGKVIVDSGVVASTLTGGPFLALTGGVMTGSITGVTQLGITNGSGSVIMGTSNTNGGGLNSVIIGPSAHTTGTTGEAVSIGDNSSADGFGVAIGTNTVANGLAVTIGPNATASGIAIGYGSSSTTSSTNAAIGPFSVASGTVNCSSFGTFATASGPNSNAFGAHTTASADSSNAIGFTITNSIAHSTLIGDAAHVNIRPASLTCDLGTTLLPFQSLYLSGNITVAGNSILAANIVSNSGSGPIGNIPSFVSSKVIQDSAIAANTIVIGPASVVNGNVCSFNGTTGKLITDGGKVSANLVTDSGTAASGNVTTYTGNRVIHDSGTPLSSLLTVVNAGATYMPLAGGTFSGTVSMGSNQLNSTGPITASSITTTSASCFAGYTSGGFNVPMAANTAKLIATGTLTELSDPLGQFTQPIGAGEVKYTGATTRNFKVEILYNLAVQAVNQTYVSWISKGGSLTQVAARNWNWTTAMSPGYQPCYVATIYSLAQNDVVQLAGQYTISSNVNVFDIQVIITPMT